MLVLSRMLSEAIIIDGSIRVSVVQVKGDRVKLGIESPREVSVHREEIQKSIDLNGKRSGS